MKSLVSSISLSITAVLLFFATNSNAQVGIGTAAPEAALDVSSTNAGLLLPRIALTSVTVVAPITNPNGGAVVDGTMIWNTGTGGVTPAGYYYWQNSRWNQLINNEPQVFIGRVVINAAGSQTIMGIPFRPTSIEFTAISNTETENGGHVRSTNANNKDNSVGYTFGYAKSIATSPFIEQIAISGAGSGASINRVGNYSSTNHCFAAQFVNQEAIDQGRTSGSLTSFNTNGFTINVTDFRDPIVLLFKAYRY